MERREAEAYSTPWGVYDGADEKTVHVAPMFGPQHELTDTCWCHPERRDDEPDLVIHNVGH